MIISADKKTEREVSSSYILKNKTGLEKKEEKERNRTKQAQEHHQREGCG